MRVFALICGWFILVIRAYSLVAPKNNGSTVEVLMKENTSVLQLQWYPNATSTIQVVQHQLRNTSGPDIIKGALVPFPEYGGTRKITTTPWIAYICCDFNGTHPSLEDDVISSAQLRGATAVLLYSRWSEACMIDAEYANSATFGQPFAIFTTRSLESARMIENIFSSISREPGACDVLLPDSTPANISEGTMNGKVLSGCLVATAMKVNTLLPRNISNSTTSDAGAENSDGSYRVFLYVLSGILLPFCCIGLVIGIKHVIHRSDRAHAQERMLAMVAFGQGRTRALKITRTILDTFPTMTFGSMQLAQWKFGKQNEEQKAVDIESQHGQAPACDCVLTSGSNRPPSPPQNIPAPTASTTSPSDGAPRVITEGTSSAANPSSHTNKRGPNVCTSSGTHPTPDNLDHNIISRTLEPVDRETCPICINEFETGDEVRILPCEARHIFHRTCIDSWLLERSSRCPICRYDFRALKNTSAGNREAQGNRTIVEEQHASNMDSSSS